MRWAPPRVRVGQIMLLYYLLDLEMRRAQLRKQVGLLYVNVGEGRACTVKTTMAQWSAVDERELCTVAA